MVPHPWDNSLTRGFLKIDSVKLSWRIFKKRSSRLQKTIIKFKKCPCQNHAEKLLLADFLLHDYLYNVGIDIETTYNRSSWDLVQCLFPAFITNKEK